VHQRTSTLDFRLRYLVDIRVMSISYNTIDSDDESVVPSRSQQNNVTCPLCGVAFPMERINAHADGCTGTTQAKTIPAHRCPICSSSFATVDELCRHAEGCGVAPPAPTSQMNGRDPLAFWHQMFPRIPRDQIAVVIKGRDDENAIWNRLTKLKKRYAPLGDNDSPEDDSEMVSEAEPAETPAYVPRASPQSTSQLTAPKMPLSRTAACTYLIHWDYDNMPIPEGQAPADYVGAIRNFLEREAQSHQLRPTLIFTTYVTPRSRIGDWQKNALRDLNVRIVECGTKSNDADRQLQRCVKDTLVLGVDPQVAVFVLITSDKDFTDLAEEVKRSGCQVWAIHDARRGSHHEQVLTTIFTKAVPIRAFHRFA
jgi:hypothetical protein